jgi:hypothetical protein
MGGFGFLKDTEKGRHQSFYGALPEAIPIPEHRLLIAPLQNTPA